MAVAVNPFDIIERQLQILKDRSDKGVLTFDEIKSLESLIKLQLILKLKAGDGDQEDDAFQHLTIDELKDLVKKLA